MTLSQRILVKSRNICLKTEYIIGVSEIMDLGKEACPIMQVNPIIYHVLLSVALADR